jgi:hypothetical protein
MKRRIYIVLVASLAVLGIQLPANASPEGDNPDYYSSVPWSIPAGLEDFTVPTKYAPTANKNQRYTPYCVDATCTPDPSDTTMMKITRFKTAHANIRDFTAETIAGAADQREAAKAIFYRVRDLIQLEDVDFLGAYGAWKYRAGSPTAKASLLIAMARSAKIPARYVIREATVTPRHLGYNAANSTGLTDDSTLDPAVFNSEHVYAEVNINGEWIAADPAWNAGLAAAFETARFGEELKSVKKQGGQATRVAELPDEFVDRQPHPYLIGQTIDSATYSEDALHSTAPPQLGYLYWRDANSPLNLYIKNMRYRSTVRDMSGVANYGIAELQQYRDQTPVGTADFMAATNAMDQLKQALKDLGKGKTEQALVRFESAETGVRAVSTFYDNLDLQQVRYRLAGFTRQNAEFAFLKFQEANPPTMNINERNDNVGLNWQVLYGFDDDHWLWDGTTYVEGAGPLGIELGCNDQDYVPGTWSCSAGVHPYIIENLLISFYASFGIPFKITDIDDDNYTVLFDPKNVFLNPMAPPPEVLVDGDGGQYDPAGADFDNTAPFGVGAFFNNIPVYSIPGANGIPDFFEGASAGSFRMFRMMGGYEFQRERQTPDDMHNCNTLLDMYPDYSCTAIFAMDNQVAKDTIERAADQGAQKLILDTGNLVEADFTDLGYGWEIGRYIAASSNPAMEFRIKGAQSYQQTFIDGVVDYVEAELARPEYAGKRVVVGLLSHGFPTHSLIEEAFGYPGCTDQWLPGSPYLCPFVTGVPYDWGADFPEDLRQPGLEIDEYFVPTGNQGLFIYPTGYVYGEDQWHGNNFAFEADAVAAITARGTGPGTLFAQLDSNGNGVIQGDEIFVIQNDFTEGDFDLSDIWLAGTEMTGIGTINFPGPGNSCTGGRCVSVNGEFSSRDAKLKEKIDAEGQHIDYFIDIPFLWGIESSESIHHRMTLFDAFRKGPPNMVWLDDSFRTEQVFEPSGPRFCGSSDPNLCWGPGYDPITIVMTPQATEHEDATRAAIVETFVDCVDSYATCGREINVPAP